MAKRPFDPFDVRAARVAALDCLARRDRSAADLRRKLLEKGYDKGVVAPLLEALRTEKLVDDRRYSENFLTYQAARGQGPMRVRLGLRQKGVEDVIVDDCLAAYPDWHERLRELRQKKFGSKPAADFLEKQRQARFLNYRGFTSAQIRSALGSDVDLED